MPPIPVHIDDPITPQKAQGITHQTADSSPAVPPPTTTAEQSPYPAARPGAAAFPAPTPYMPSPHPQPTRTTTSLETQQDALPPPQPGAVPTPSYQAASATTTSALPPPPKAGESAQPPSQTTPFTSALNQMYISPPQQNYAPTHSTSTTTQQSYAKSGPTALPLGPVSSPAVGGASDHPPGYQQNIYAQEMTPAQRASLDQETRRESLVQQLGLGGVGGVGGGGGSLLGGGEGTAGETAGNAWNAAKGWLSKAGQTLAETEEQIWKRVNGER